MPTLLMVNLIGLYLAAGEPGDFGPGAEITHLSIVWTARRRTGPITSYHATTLLRTAGYLAAELTAEDLPRDLRVQLLIKLGELTATAWAHRPPATDENLPDGVKRLVTEARSFDRLTCSAAESSLRLIIDTLAGHARAAAYAASAGPGTIERALMALARVDHELAIHALLALSRDAVEPGARHLAAGHLGELAARKNAVRFAESCAQLLLE